jgi:hypothetical protein
MSYVMCRTVGFISFSCFSYIFTTAAREQHELTLVRARSIRFTAPRGTEGLLDTAFHRVESPLTVSYSGIPPPPLGEDKNPRFQITVCGTPETD